MTIYAYQCSVCSGTFELNKKISDRDSTDCDVCPHCESVGKMTRLVSAPMIAYSVTVKGSYGSKIPDGFKEVLQKIDARAPGSRLKETSSFL